MVKSYAKNWKLIQNAIAESLPLKCPKCDEGNLFQSYLKIKPEITCSSCKLSIVDFDVGDGPAYVAGFLICFLVPILAIIIEVAYQPALLVHAFLWTSCTLILTYVSLIYLRSMFIHLEYKIRKLEKG